MDYKGQQLSENIYYFLTILFGAIAWVVGYIQNDFQVTVYGWAAGLAISLLICIPDWPFFNRNKVIWADEVGQLKPAEGGKKNKQDKKEKGDKATKNN